MADNGSNVGGSGNTTTAATPAKPAAASQAAPAAERPTDSHYAKGSEFAAVMGLFVEAEKKDIVPLSLVQADGTPVPEKCWRIHRIGSGHFGTVFEGTFGGRRVAIKVLSDGIDTTAALAEGSIMARLKHDNVLECLGCYRESKPAGVKAPVFIITLFCEHGSLSNLLRSFSFTDQQLVKFALQIATGMTHTHAVNVVHRDLRADNVFIFHDEFGEVMCKVGDFGLSRAVDLTALNARAIGAKAPAGEPVKEGYYIAPNSTTPVPYRVYSPEALEGRFSRPSDVWSFGCLLWEISTRCMHPLYEGLRTRSEVEQFIRTGGRLKMPPTAPTVLALLAEDCWQADPHKRPSFADIVRRLSAPAAQQALSLEVKIPLADGGIDTEQVSVEPTMTFQEVVQHLAKEKKDDYQLRTAPDGGMALLGNVVQICAQQFPGQRNVTVYLRKKKDRVLA